MNAQSLIAMLGRKNVTLAAGVLIGAVLVADNEALLKSVREYTALLGSGGVMALIVSVILSLGKEKQTAEAIKTALYTEPPKEPPKP